MYRPKGTAPSLRPPTSNPQGLYSLPLMNKNYIIQFETYA